MSECQSSVEVCAVVAEGVQFGGRVTISTGEGTALSESCSSYSIIMKFQRLVAWGITAKLKFTIYYVIMIGGHNNLAQCMKP